MSRFTAAMTVVSMLALGSVAMAQAPARPAPMPGGPGGAGGHGMPMGGPGMMDAASMLLAHTGEFKLSDQQVTRLAAIARRTSERRKAMMASVDSMRDPRPAEMGGAAGGRGAVGPAAPTAAQRAFAERMFEQAHADVRDAIAVLTPDQQAMGWEMMARQGGHGMMMRGDGMRQRGGMMDGRGRM